MERMTGLDATFLYLETPDQLMTINGVIILDVSTMEGGYSFERLRAELMRRVKEIPQFRRKIYNSALNMGHPAWVEEYTFDVDAHLHRTALPTGSAEDELSDLCGQLAGRPLDRTRPLWEAWVIEGHADPDRIAVFCRAHHSILDGISSVDLIGRLATTDSSHPARSAELVRRHTGGPNPLRLLFGGMADMSLRPLHFVRLLPETLAVPLSMRRSSGGAKSSEGMPAPFTAPRTLFNSSITPLRALSFVSLPLDEIREIKNAFGTTVNDVLLAAVGGALRDYLSGEDQLPEESLMAVLPVSTHAASGGSGANQITAMFASLATDCEDAVDRLLRISQRTDTGKSQSSGVRPRLLEDWASLAPAWVMAAGARLYGALRLADLHPVVYNLIVSNVPGPAGPIHFLGARIEHIFPMGPLFHGAGISVTAVSSDGRLDVGVIACEHLVPDPELIAEGIASTTAELLAAARS